MTILSTLEGYVVGVVGTGYDDVCPSVSARYFIDIVSTKSKLPIRVEVTKEAYAIVRDRVYICPTDKVRVDIILSRVDESVDKEGLYGTG